MAFFTDAQVLAVFPEAANLTPAQITQTTFDITAIYNWASSNPGISEADLRAWGESQTIDPDRMTRALGLLQLAGKLFALPDAGPLAPSPAPTPPPAPAPTPTARRRSTKSTAKAKAKA